MNNFEVLNVNSLAKDLNNYTYSDYYYRLMLLARSVFKWENLPNGIDEKWIEKYLFSYGACMFFKDEQKGFMVAKATPSGNLNAYDEPTLLTPYGTNYMGKPLLNGDECVLIRNNDDMIPTSPTIQLYAYRLTELTRTIDINVEAQKTPVLIRCNERQKLTLKNVYKQWKGNEPVIYGDKSLNTDAEKMEVLKTDAPIVFDKLQQQKHAIWNECMTYLGVNNANMDKRERLVDDEVQANDEQIELCANIALKSREEACNRINELFGTNISVSLRKLKFDYPEELDEGGVNND